jgi:NAD(P)H-hydrate repair Nnr-like enzyme with NAD(P)H-hydrate dehydratase domain
MYSAPSLARLLGALATVAGVVHLLAPRALLATAASAYDRLLAVEFDPRDAAPTRVRAVGAVLVAVGLGLVRREGAKRRRGK